MTHESLPPALVASEVSDLCGSLRAREIPDASYRCRSLAEGSPWGPPAGHGPLNGDLQCLPLSRLRINPVERRPVRGGSVFPQPSPLTSSIYVGAVKEDDGIRCQTNMITCLLAGSYKIRTVRRPGVDAGPLADNAPEGDLPPLSPTLAAGRCSIGWPLPIFGKRSLSKAIQPGDESVVLCLLEVLHQVVMLIWNYLF